jgi:serine/threonine protein phosphatase PrpC
MDTPFHPSGMPLTPLEPTLRRARADDQLCVGAASACGSGHEANEDAHSPARGDGRLFVVADGVGGGAKAQLASRHLVAVLHAALERGGTLDDDRVRAAVLDADRRVARRIARETDRAGAATFVLCAAIDAPASRWLVAWVGDCRVYRQAGATIECLTRDHSFARLRETPPAGGRADDPARMVGNGAVGQAEVARHTLAPGALLALCTDGVHRHLDSADWLGALRRPLPLAQRCRDLVALARLRGSRDDATVLLLQRGGAGDDA